MKVILPVIDAELEKHNLAQGFHNAEYACIYDSSNNSYEWLATEEISKKAGNLSIELKRKGIYSIISKSMPLMALGLFAESGLKVFRAQSDTVDENISLFNDNLLEPLTIQSLMGLSDCSGGCSSCGSSCN